MKIGITLDASRNSLFTSGINQNGLYLALLFNKGGHNASLLYSPNNSGKSLDEIKDLPIDIVEFKEAVVQKGHFTINLDHEPIDVDGDEFDSGEYFTASLNNLIVGWQEGLQYIGEGGKITMVIPSGIAYGSSGSGPIGPNEVIAFDVTLHYFTN